MKKTSVFLKEFTVIKDEPETRMKANLQQAIISKTKDVLKESQDLQIEFKANLKSKVSRQAKYIDPSISEDQIKEICNDPEVLLIFNFLQVFFKVFYTFFFRKEGNYYRRKCSELRAFNCRMLFLISKINFAISSV